MIRRLSSFIVPSKKGSETSLNDADDGPTKAIGMGRRLSLNTVHRLQKIFVAKDARKLSSKISPGSSLENESDTETRVAEAAGAGSEPEIRKLSRISDESILPSPGAVSPEKGVGEAGTRKHRN